MPPVDTNRPLIVFYSPQSVTSVMRARLRTKLEGGYSGYQNQIIVGKWPERSAFTVVPVMVLVSGGITRNEEVFHRLAEWQWPAIAVLDTPYDELELARMKELSIAGITAIWQSPDSGERKT